MEILKSLDRARSRDDILRGILPRLKPFGIEYIISAMIPQNRLPARTQKNYLILENTPEEWRRLYFSKGYMYQDPIVQATLQNTTGFAWAEVEPPAPLDARARQVMGEAREFGLADGFTVPLATLEEERGGLTFAGPRLEISPAQRGILTLLASCMVGQTLLIDGGGGERPMILTQRERESLQWAAEGKTDWEIGELMGISQHGADFHLRSARLKLGCVTRTQAVAEGMRRGLIV
ncbi:autoinducer binding domain-containing protein [Methylobacterium sp. Leaf118]|uniref:autoinducer binding domain-containing protein n=1 Tax=Methylobacterium sp. Leaf118 TaxID=2876562 RepID=UPI001E343D95|nr:autoinducer binding domain-containing protein [Methylobacterium sp. Leaf118]